MSIASSSFLHDNASPILSARIAELVQYMGAPMLGRLTDEQRSLSLAIARRVVMSVAQRIDPDMDGDQLWSDWLIAGVPVNDDLAIACFARAEEHRWRAASEGRGGLMQLNSAYETMDAEPLSLSWPTSDIACAYRELLVTDRRRFNGFGYPALAIPEVGDDLYRHLLNEIARWRLDQVSRDRKSSAGLGDAVRSAWKQKSDEQGIDDSARNFFNHLLAADYVYDAANAAVLRHDWPCFISLASVSQGRSYGNMALFLLTSSMKQIANITSSLRISEQAMATLEASLTACPSRAAMEEAEVVA